MKKFMNFLKKHSKKLAVISAVSVAVLGVGVASSWGPDRPTYTVENPADHITFNSITNNPHVGDERNFVVVKDAASQTSGGWQDDVTVQPGKEYLVRIYVHNNANKNLNLVAQNTRVKASVPTTTGKKVPLSGFVSADNATPREVWDDASFNSARDFNIAYVPGSARIYNNGYAAGGNGKALPDSIVTSAGAQVGYNAADGKVPGCFEFVSYVTFKVKPQFATQPDYSIEKEVRKKGTTDWAKNIKAQPGDEVEWRMQFRNTGETQLNNVAIVDQTPTNTTTVANSVEIFDANRPNGFKFGPEAIQGKLINLMIGNYGAKSNAWIYYNSKIDSKDKIPCEATKLVNKVYATPNGMPTIKDEASIEVEKDCEPVEKPKYECSALEAIRIGENKYRFTTSVRAQDGATVNKYVYNFGDNTEELNTTDATVEHTYPGPGSYTAIVRVVFDVNGEQKEVGGANCKVTINIPEEPCPYNPELPKDHPDCKKKPPVTPPVTPPGQPPVTVIPDTGMAGVIAGVFGTSATAYGAYAWFESRRALKNIK